MTPNPGIGELQEKLARYETAIRILLAICNNDSDIVKKAIAKSVDTDKFVDSLIELTETPFVINILGNERDNEKHASP